MSFPKHLFKSPGSYGAGSRSYAVAGAADKDEEAALIGRGWHKTKEAAWGEEAGTFDQDGDGEPGGSKAPERTDELAALRQEYAEKIGKRPFPGWGADELRSRMAAA